MSSVLSRDAVSADAGGGLAARSGGGPHRGWLILPVCLAGWCFSNLDQSLFAYAIPGIRASFGASLADMGWILSLSFAVGAVATVAFGLISDRLGRRLLFTFTLAGSALFVGLQSVMPSLVTLGLARMLGFALGNGLAPIVITYTAETASPRLRGLAVGMINLGYPLGGMLGGLMVGPLLGLGGWRMIFAPAFAVVPVAVVLGLLLPESRAFTRKRAPAATMSWQASLACLFSPAMRRGTIACMVANFLFGGAYAGTAFYFPTFFHEFRGFSTGDSAHLIGVALGIGASGYILSALVGDFLMSRRNTIVLWMWIGGAAMLALVWLPRTYGENLAAMAVMASFFYGASGVYAAFMPEMFPAHLRATGMAVVGSLAMYLGFAAFPVAIARAIAVWGWQPAFSACAVPLFLAGGALLLTDKRPHGFADDDRAQEAVA